MNLTYTTILHRIIYNTGEVSCYLFPEMVQEFARLNTTKEKYPVAVVKGLVDITRPTTETLTVITTYLNS